MHCGNMAASTEGSQPLVMSQTNPKHTATLIFLHGSCNTGPQFISDIKSTLGHDLVFKHIKIIYPTAPERPHTMSNGELNTVWFDRLRLDPTAPESLDDIASVAEVLNDIVNSEVQLGIPKRNIIVGGYSMGGGMALHYVYRYQPDIAGCFGMSSFLATDSAVYKALEDTNHPYLPQLFMSHGTFDSLVDFKWGEQTAKKMKELGVDTVFLECEDDHELSKECLSSLNEWIWKVLPSPV